MAFYKIIINLRRHGAEDDVSKVRIFLQKQNQY